MPEGMKIDQIILASITEIRRFLRQVKVDLSNINIQKIN